MNQLGKTRSLTRPFWKGERAERIEVALFDAAPKLRPPQAGYQWEQADPLTTFDLKRFNAVRGYQAQQGREISRCLKELRQLRKDALVACTGEPETPQENERKSPPANDDAATPRNEPGAPAAPAPGDIWEVDGVPLLDAWGQPRRHPLAAARAGGDSPALQRSA